MNRIERVMVQLGCTTDEAQAYLELRDEGYSAYDAKVMVGLADPPEPTETIEVYADHVVTSGFAPIDLDVTAEEDEAFNSMHGELR
jgi:hypothetical protein